ncbi:MAG: hypothetical protein EOP49_18875, partial [Sphingobacteriales bacterium]
MLLGLVILVAVLVNLTPVQNTIARKAASMLSEKLKTKVTVDHIRIDFLNHVLIRGLYIEDKAGDTLLYAGEARVRITDWFIVKKDKPVIRYLGLHNAFGHLYRTNQSETWNYQFIIDAFDTGKRDSTKKQNEFEIDLEKLDIREVRFHMDDAWVGNDYDIDIGNLQVDAKEIDFRKRLIDVNTLLLTRSTVAIRDYKGGRPPRPKKPKTIDTTAFNPGRWVLRLNGLEMRDNVFSMDVGDHMPRSGEFDPQHIGVQDIDLIADNLHITGDTLRGKLHHLSGRERSGLLVKKISTDFSVSPNATICENLYLETNNSRLQNYYAMHYERFPDFQDYIHKVHMVGRLNGSSVDSRDVAYFAPQLRKLPMVVKMTGNITGTVDNLQGKKLYFTDGSTSIKGNLAMKGLPDIYTTLITFEDGEILTTNNAVFKFAPELRKNPAVAFEKLSFVHFKGNFAGYIENFAANGVINTNLGSIHSDITLSIPDFSNRMAVYRGTLATENFDLGTLLRQPSLGFIGLRAGISGAAFDPKLATLRINSIISHFDVNGYRYKNITAEGTLERRKFNGNLLVDDPNLALAFYGNIDFSTDVMNIAAKANLLKSDLRAIGLTPDSMTVAADFDVDFTGNNIDDFLGYARLYNINLTRE